MLSPSWWCLACEIGWAAADRIPCWVCGSSDPLVVVPLVRIMWIP